MGNNVYKVSETVQNTEESRRPALREKITEPNCDRVISILNWWEGFLKRLSVCNKADEEERKELAGCTSKCEILLSYGIYFSQM